MSIPLSSRMIETSKKQLSGNGFMRTIAIAVGRTGDFGEDLYVRGVRIIPVEQELLATAWRNHGGRSLEILDNKRHLTDRHAGRIWVGKYFKGIDGKLDTSPTVIADTIGGLASMHLHFRCVDFSSLKREHFKDKQSFRSPSEEVFERFFDPAHGVEQTFTEMICAYYGASYLKDAIAQHDGAKQGRIRLLDPDAFRMQDLFLASFPKTKAFVWEHLGTLVPAKAVVPG